MKCNNKYYQIAHGVLAGVSEIHLNIKTAAIINNEEQEPQSLATMEGLEVRLLSDGETGNGKILTDYTFEDGEFFVVYQFKWGDAATILIRGCIGNARVDATLVVYADGDGDVFFPDYVVKYVADGAGGGDYKTDVYMDGDGRVMVEREDDGSTTIYDEHENPIMKRLADGTTEIFDAYQSPKIQLAANGACKIMSQGGGTTAIETKSNGDLVLKTYNSNEILLDNNGGISIMNGDENTAILLDKEFTAIKFPNGDDAFVASNSGYLYIRRNGDDRIELNEDGYILYDNNGYEQIVSENGVIGIKYNGDDRILLNETGFVLYDVNGNVQVSSYQGTLVICNNDEERIGVNERDAHIMSTGGNQIFEVSDGVTIYDPDGNTFVTFDAALIQKLNNL